MAMKKVKGKYEITQRGRRDGEVNGKKRKSLSSNANTCIKSNEKRRRRGPRLPNAFRRELELRNPTVGGDDSDGDEEIDSDGAVGNKIYEYEEGIAEEETMKNKRYDRVENFEFELPEDFEVCLSLS